MAALLAVGVAIVPSESAGMSVGSAVPTTWPDDWVAAPVDWFDTAVG